MAISHVFVCVSTAVQWQAVATVDWLLSVVTGAAHPNLRTFNRHVYGDARLSKTLCTTCSIAAGSVNGGGVLHMRVSSTGADTTLAESAMHLVH